MKVIINRIKINIKDNNYQNESNYTEHIQKDEFTKKHSNTQTTKLIDNNSLKAENLSNLAFDREIRINQQNHCDFNGNPSQFTNRNQQITSDSMSQERTYANNNNKKNIKKSTTSDTPTAFLYNNDIWGKFREEGTEMIITRAGRLIVIFNYM